MTSAPESSVSSSPRPSLSTSLNFTIGLSAIGSPQTPTHRRCIITTNKTIISWAIHTDADGLIDSSGSASLDQLTKLVERTAGEGRRELLVEAHEVIDDCTERTGFDHVAWLTD